LAFEWIGKRFRSRYELSFILIGQPNSELKHFLADLNIPVLDLRCKGKSDFFLTFIRIFLHLLTHRPHVIHTHLIKANLLGLTAGWMLHIKRRIYTRHHATVHYDEHPSGRKWDVLCNSLATDIVAISQNIKNILIDWDKADGTKISVIPHGFDFAYFNTVEPERINTIRTKYDIPKDSYPVIGVIARYMQWKGIQYIIPAFKEIKKKFPQARLVLANAHGSYEKELRELLRLLPEDSFTEIIFEEDLAALYRLFDVYVHVPVDPHAEAFGQTYVEALVSGIPSVFTLSGIATEFVEHKNNAWVVDYKNSDQIEEGINVLLNDVALCRRLKLQGEKSILMFSLDNYILALDTLYNRRK
jgi:glycosyltransferase involved in cell wall biosynthesis